MAKTNEYTLKNNAGNVVTVKDGFSWTVFFFGFFVPIFRKDLKHFLILLAVWFVAAMLAFSDAEFIGRILSVVVSIFYGLNYNNWYREERLAEGYKIVGTPTDPKTPYMKAKLAEMVNNQNKVSNNQTDTTTENEPLNRSDNNNY